MEKNQPDLNEVTAKVGFIPGTLRFFTDLPEDSPVFALVGKICAEWAKLEHCLDEIIFEMVGAPNQTTSALTAQIMGAKPRLTAIVALMTHKSYDPALVSRTEKLLERCGGPQESRNRIIHDPWYLESGDDGYAGSSQFRSPRNKKTKFGYVPRGEDELQKTLEEIRNLSHETAELHFEVFKTENQKRNAPTTRG